MIEVKEVLRQWLMGGGKKGIARRVVVDVKTVRRYVSAAEACGLERSAGVEALTDEMLGRIVGELGAWRRREHGETWEACQRQASRIEGLLEEGVKLTKVSRVLKREGTTIPYATLHRFSVSELGFGKSTPTIAILEGEPGGELQVDTGWVGWLFGEGGKRRLKAWIFTATRSRHRFVYPTLQERTEEAIEACEAAWRYFGGVFHVLMPDNTKAIVETPGDLGAQIESTFREYSQARGFVVDPARVRHPKDKARVERAVSHVRDDCFGAERPKTLCEARELAERWCLSEYGARKHSRTQRRPLEHFLEEEKGKLLPEPKEPYDVPTWSASTVDRDQYVIVEKALYSVGTAHVGKKLTTRADTRTVRLYDGGVLVKALARVGAGERVTDPSDFPEAKRIYAHRDVETLKRKAAEHGESVGRMAELILECPLPWTRMRRVYALLGLAGKYGSARLEEACKTALSAEMIDVTRLKRLLERGGSQMPGDQPREVVVSIARYLRPRTHFALRREV